MGLRDWVSEKARMRPHDSFGRGLLQWGSETGSRRRSLLAKGLEAEAKCFNGAPRLGLGEGHGRQHPVRLSCHRASMGLRDWVSEKGHRQDCPAHGPQASMGLRDWVSEKAWSTPLAAGMVGERASMGLRDWVSEKAAVLVPRPAAVRGMLQWGSETGSRRRTEPTSVATAAALRLQWGSETGSRRRAGPAASAARLHLASMGFRDWVSEKAKPGASRSLLWRALQWGSETGSRRRFQSGTPLVAAYLLQWGSETGSRRRSAAARATASARGRASMGLRDWVSEKVGGVSRR